MEYTAKNSTQLREIAHTLLETLPKDQAQATVLGFSGELGAGKTTFTKALASELGVKDTITSPTFVIEKLYPLPSKSLFEMLIHIDAYRLEEGEDLAFLGWEDILKNKGNLIVVEWPERVGSILPQDARVVNFSVVDEETRKISW